MYRGRSREDTKPHIYAIADEAFRNLVEEGQNQSILVTGESGAGKTENTKKVIQYLAAVATTDTPRASKSGGRHLSSLSEQILRANPILEAFGNAQTVRNNNSSRFGKFIRIEFTRSGQIAGAYVDWYLLEKSRVVRLNSMERNYHVFYQLLRGADDKTKRELRLKDLDIGDFEYTRQGNDAISGVSDHDEWNSLIEAFHVMGFSDKDQASILRTIAAVLHLGNIQVMKESLRADQAAFNREAIQQAELVAQILGIPSDQFINGLLHPQVKAGREWVKKVQTPEQVHLSIDALAKGMYERQFGDLVNRINRQLNRTNGTSDESHFIGVLDIAGFEIFDDNSFEQLCINYTNEKLQQFFNHHMFVLEQEEYAREQIEWKFIDFGKDLQPTIDLIELSNPIGIFSCLDEDSVMPKATDASFTDKLNTLWDRKTPKYRRSLRSQGFILTHYAAEVEYSTEGWLEKNKDPMNDNVTRLLACSTDKHIADLFSDCAETDDEPGSAKNRVKKGLFRTVAQRHKEQLGTLMNQLHSTHPHFVRCILPNHKKKAKQFHAPLVLDQLRCNGVLEGIRIARTGFPNRLPFSEFRSRYEVLCKDMPKSYIEGQFACRLILQKLNMDSSFYRVGLTKVFFRAGVLADLEERRDELISEIMGRFQSLARGFVQRRSAHKKLYRAEATRIIQRNFQIYSDLQGNPWWRLFVRMKPLLGATRQAAEVKKRDDMIQKLQQERDLQAQEKQRLDDERRRAEGDILKIQQTLESERALALDKEEIFKRLQNREAQLTDELAQALQEQEKLENELDAIIEVQQRAQSNADAYQKEVIKAAGLIKNLEVDKQDLQRRVQGLDDQLTKLEAAKSKRSAEEERLTQELLVLQSQLSLKDRKLHEIESRALSTAQDLDVKFASTEKELAAARKQAREFQDQNLQIRAQMAELSSTSTSFEDLIRQKESELSLLKSDLRKHESDRHAVESEKQALLTKHDTIQSQLRALQSEMEKLKVQKMQAEHDAADAKSQLQKIISDDEGRRILEKQVGDLRTQLVSMQADLTRERQSRDDVQMLGEHKFSELKRNFDSLTESKITIEKELYAQQDILRRVTAGRTTAELERKNFQNELRALREKYLAAQEGKLQAETEAEKRLIQAANERQASMRREMDEKDRKLMELDEENAKLANEVQGLTQMMADSDNFKSLNDQHKDRLEREVSALRGRLAASENDNRAMLSKIQQKNLDIARSSSRAGDASRGRIAQLTSEKTKAEDHAKRLNQQLADAQLTISSLEKQKEKLSMSLEDLNHEITREHKVNRNAEKQTSTATIQLAEVNRKLETERQLRTQAQVNTRTVQSSLDQANRELEEARQHLVLLQKVFDPSSTVHKGTFEAAIPSITRTVDLAKQLETSEQALRIADERCEMLESQLEDMRDRHGSELATMEARHSDSKRVLLEEMTNGQVNARNSPAPLASIRGLPAMDSRRPYSPATPKHTRHISEQTNDSVRSDRTTDTITQVGKMDLEAQLELVQNQLQIAEMRNRHLQNQIDRNATTRTREDDQSPSIKRLQKLERENFKLHDQLDSSAKKEIALEKSLRAGQLSLGEVQAKSHQELYDFIGSQENARKSLAQSHSAAIKDLAEAKTAFDQMRTTKANFEAELREVTSQLNDLQYERERESANHSQLLQEFADLQIRLDSETSRLVDVESSLGLYKQRADEYFNKLEAAEIAVLKASRAEQFAKTQAREAEETCATMMAERKTLDATIEDLTRQAQQQDERIEDLSADLEGVLQAKRRLQNEVEDYRSQRAMDIEDKELSHEQTRKKYQSELSNLSNELEIERDNLVHEREENSRLRVEIEELQGKWDDELLNSSTWSKEKSRLEMTVQELNDSRDEAVAAHNDAQSKIVNLLTQVRDLRSNMDETSAERDAVIREKRTLENRLSQANARLDDLTKGDVPSIRNAAAIDRDLLDVRGRLAQQEDIVEAAVGKMRRAEALAQEAQKDLQSEREHNVQLHKDKAALEKSTKELQLRLVDLETKGYSSNSQDVKFLHGRIKEVSQHDVI